MSAQTLSKKHHARRHPGHRGYVVPPADILETDDNFVIYVELPGVSRENLSIEVEDHLLSIRGKVERSQEKSGDVRARYREYRLADKLRQFQLRTKIEEDKIEAKLENGVLRLTLPKAAEEKPRKIEVQAQ